MRERERESDRLAWVNKQKRQIALLSFLFEIDVIRVKIKGLQEPSREYETMQG